jgi:hypothetical protein
MKCPRCQSKCDCTDRVRARVFGGQKRMRAYRCRACGKVFHASRFEGDWEIDLSAQKSFVRTSARYRQSATA